MKFTNDHAIGFFTSKDIENMDIIGTSVTPEFGIITIMILGVSILGVNYYSRRSSGIILTRIN